MQDLNRIPRYNLEHGVENLIKIHQLAHQKPGEIDVEIRTPKVLENLREIAKEYRGAIIHDESIYTLITFTQPLNDTGMIFPKDSESIIEKGERKELCEYFKEGKFKDFLIIDFKGDNFQFV